MCGQGGTSLTIGKGVVERVYAWNPSERPTATPFPLVRDVPPRLQMSKDFLTPTYSSPRLLFGRSPHSVASRLRPCNNRGLAPNGTHFGAVVGMSSVGGVRFPK